MADPRTVEFADRGAKQRTSIRFATEVEARRFDHALNRLADLEQIWRQLEDDVRISFSVRPSGEVVGYVYEYSLGYALTPCFDAHHALGALAKKFRTALAESVLYGLCTKARARPIRAALRAWHQAARSAP